MVASTRWPARADRGCAARRNSRHRPPRRSPGVALHAPDLLRICSLASACSSSHGERRRHSSPTPPHESPARPRRSRLSRCSTVSGADRRTVTEADGRRAELHQTCRPSTHRLRFWLQLDQSGSSKAVATTTPAGSALQCLRHRLRPFGPETHAVHACTRTPKAMSATSALLPTGNGYRWGDSDRPSGKAALRRDRQGRRAARDRRADTRPGRHGAEGVRDAAEADRRYRLAIRRCGEPQIGSSLRHHEKEGAG